MKAGQNIDLKAIVLIKVLVAVAQTQSMRNIPATVRLR